MRYLRINFKFYAILNNTINVYIIKCLKHILIYLKILYLKIKIGLLSMNLSLMS